MNVKKIPNYLCIFRIAVTPIIMFILMYERLLSNIFPFVLYKNTLFGKFMTDNLDLSNSYAILIAGVIFLLAVFTDLIDGSVARKYKAESDKGKMLDPLADKILILGTLISFFLIDDNYHEQLIMIWPVLIIIIREIIVTALRTYTAKRGVVVGATFWGKLKTVSQTIALIIWFISEFVHFPIYGRLAVIAAAIITLISLFPYLYKFAGILLNKKSL